MVWRPPENSQTSPLIYAVQQAAFHVNWQFIHTEEEIGRHFLDNYAYFELIGPTGHFRSDQCCAFIGYWGPGLFYPAHHHASEELYFVLAGHALFESDGDSPATLGLAAHRLHASPSTPCHDHDQQRDFDNGFMARARVNWLVATC